MAEKLTKPKTSTGRKKRISTPFTYIDSSEYDSLINQDNLPYALRRGGIFICLGGEGEVIINEHKYHLSRNTMCVAFPGTIIQAFDTEEKFKSYTLVIDIDFLRELNIPSPNSVHMSIKEHPCVILTDEQLSSIMGVCEMMHNKDKRSSHPYHKQINSLMLTLLCYELAGVYMRNAAVKRQPCSRQDMVFRRFMSLLATDITISREVQYYADKLDISPKYLTIITRQLSSYSASDWIIRTAITNAKALLATTTLTVQQVGERLNFPNPSFFGQYFLRHTGMTPREFRHSKL